MNYNIRTVNIVFFLFFLNNMYYIYYYCIYIKIINFEILSHK